jgi:membrane protease YdiL (CAAX protease family)
MLLIGIPIGAVLAFGEEYGWRGYLLPKLLSLGEVKASLLVAAIWAPWHLPVLLAGLNYPGKSIPVVMVVFGMSTVVLSLLHTRFFVASGMSVFVVSVLHGSLNTLSDGITDSSHIAGNPLLISGGGLIATGLLTIAVVGAYVARRLRRRVADDSRGSGNQMGMAA